MRRVLARAVAVLALVASIGVSTTAPADAAQRPSKQPAQVTAADWWW